MTIAQDLEKVLGLKNCTYKSNLEKVQLFHEAIKNDRGRTKKGGGYNDQKAFATKLGDKGPLVYYTDPDSTGRRVNDTFGVAYSEFEEKVWWKADFSKFDPEKYEGLLARVVAYLNEQKATLYTQDLYCGTDAEYSIPVRFVGQYATHAMFSRIMFSKKIDGIQNAEAKRWTILNVPHFRTEPARDGTRSDAAIILDFRKKIVLIVGPSDYCGTIKKSMFSVLNFVLPDQGFLGMHCSANVGPKGDSAILFGLSGTGKTTLSADPERKLIGDDETGWTEKQISNFEDGCYAKLIDLNKEAEPVIANALSMPGTIIENVPPLKTKALADTDPQELDLTDKSINENTRFAYGLECNPLVQEGACGPHPSTIVLLTADAFGVLPPVSILSPEEVMYHFVSGFTAKLAGTEVGVKEPKETFSACFGAPFMSRKPNVYAELLGKKMQSAKAMCVLLNTGWTGGPYGVGKRISIKLTRELLNAALRGDLKNVPTETHPILGLKMPKSCPNVPAEMLNPRNTWSDKAAYDAAAEKLKGLFRKNFEDKGFAKFGIKPAM